MKQKRVKLTGGRYYIHQYMNIYAAPLEFIFVAALSYRFLKLWKKNEVQNLKNILKAEHLHYRELLDWPTIIVILLYVRLVKIKSENVARCVGVEDSIATWVDAAAALLFIPMIPLLFRRLGIISTETTANSNMRILKKRENRERRRIEHKYKITQPYDI